ncbi:MAG: HEPN domain-containing protein [Negativicutes bacterium]|jgi:hypothetical protein
MNTLSDLISYRRICAKETLDDARLLYEHGKYRSAVNRIYYGCFYEVVALLLTHNLSSSKHGGIMGLFNREFVNSGLVDVDLGRFFGRMFEYRQKADYGDVDNFEVEQVGRWLVTASLFIDSLERLFDPAE